RPAERTVRSDFFGIRIESVSIETPHRTLRIDSRSRVTLSRHAPGRNADSPAWEGVREAAFEVNTLGAASPIGYVFASPLVPLLDIATTYAAESFPPSRGILAGSVELMHRIRTGFKYDPKATVISTPLTEVFEKRHGVCQDFAHAMIAGLRGLGLPAAYVSRAWASVWSGEEISWGWFRPSNGRGVGCAHSVLAVGWDFSDVAC